MTMIYEEIKELRVKKGLSVKEVAQQLGIEERTYRYYESGRTQLSLEVLSQLTTLLGVGLLVQGNQLFLQENLIQPATTLNQHFTKFEVETLKQELLDEKESQKERVRETIATYQKQYGLEIDTSDRELALIEEGYSHANQFPCETEISLSIQTPDGHEKYLNMMNVEYLNEEKKVFDMVEFLDAIEHSTNATIRDYIEKCFYYSAYYEQQGKELFDWITQDYLNLRTLSLYSPYLAGYESLVSEVLSQHPSQYVYRNGADDYFRSDEFFIMNELGFAEEEETRYFGLHFDNDSTDEDDENNEDEDENYFTEFTVDILDAIEQLIDDKDEEDE